MFFMIVEAGVGNIANIYTQHHAMDVLIYACASILIPKFIKSTIKRFCNTKLTALNVCLWICAWITEEMFSISYGFRCARIGIFATGCKTHTTSLVRRTQANKAMFIPITHDEFVRVCWVWEVFDAMVAVVAQI